MPAGGGKRKKKLAIRRGGNTNTHEWVGDKRKKELAAKFAKKHEVFLFVLTHETLSALRELSG